ncbi:hypothetical protein MTR_0012s0220 [Medicago truncatula]|uniref:Uncharacterized protein n=1 Tax=Medicago truncatula TaxID=3880 RepID=G7ZYB5_MEDTR|nr:hypothetical protein MTR_0012s0220 [Medicago truncatula]
MKKDTKFANRKYMLKALRESHGILILYDSQHRRSTKSRLMKTFIKNITRPGWVHRWVCIVHTSGPLGRAELGLFYPGGGVVDSMSCTIFGSATKRLKESDLVVTQPSINFGRKQNLENQNTTVWKSKNNSSSSS